MFKQTFNTILLVGFCFSALSAEASHRSVKLGAINIAGSGCPQGTASVSTDRRTGQLMIAPESFAAILENGARVSRKSCNFAIPFQGVSGRAVRLTLPRIKGGVALDQDVKAEISYEIFAAGQRGDKQLLTFQGEPSILESKFDETDSLQQIEFACGESGIIRGNANAMVLAQSELATVGVAHVEQIGLKIDSVPCY